MIYSNLEFFLLLFITLPLFYGFQNVRLKAVILSLASMIFLVWSGWINLLVFLGVVLLTWTLTYLSDRFSGQKKLTMILGVSVLTLHLFFWKYSAWLMGQVSPSFLPAQSLSILASLPLPIGISFFTLQGMSFLIDVGRGRAKHTSFLNFFLYKGFFAQLVAGPIARGNQLLPQIKHLHPATSKQWMEGTLLFALGLVKKIVIADRLAPYVDQIFLSPSSYDRTSLAFALFGYSFQIWADFSGYTDMGRGIAKLFGIELPENFNAPYFAKGFSDFWRRWHITLSEWIRDYIYFPLGGSRGHGFRVMMVLMVTMGISGFWHGANWTFVLWGLYHGLLLAIEKQVQTSAVAKRLLSHFPSLFREAFLRALTFGAVVVGWCLFRSDSWGHFLHYCKSWLSGQGTIHQVGLNVAATLLLGLFLQTATFHFGPLDKLVTRTLSVPLRWAPHQLLWRAYAALVPFLWGGLVASSIAMALFLRNASTSPNFVYFQF